MITVNLYYTGSNGSAKAFAEEMEASGIAEAIRVKSLQITDKAMLSRGASVIRGRTLIVNLPGSPKAVKESLGFILGALDHGLGILRGTATD